ncbi:elongation factor P maturation arginine rhamnosyltransferase EarP [Ferrovum sp.]|uniref:elongation factor P maturation arginine rhamnosyltransferase EarP n=1 Tax=Ferrovum sp. TaxID=2609467 RepID=UPI00260CD0DD|nr:elongation factor P maturation arginine rhamnosyltransferase EarP [Ferrovum sp.]
MSTHAWWIFCRVVDNLGDAGVSWRLARQLAALSSAPPVTLVIDHLQTLARLCPALVTDAPTQQIQGVRILPWAIVEQDPAQLESEDHDLPVSVVSSFSCDLPASVQAFLQHRRVIPRWILFDYLSAESWVEGCHGLPAPIPGYSGPRNFFFPGFTPRTGGLLREPGLLARRSEVWNSLARQKAIWRSWGLTEKTNLSTLTLFAYPDAPWQSLREAMVRTGQAWRWILFEGMEITERIGRTDPFRAPAGEAWGRIEPVRVALRTQDEYDGLLWVSRFNLVRGEDSFVRAQWAGRPFLWHLYPQAEGGHRAKLDAFLERYLAGLETVLAEAVADLFRAWNGWGEMTAAWQGIEPRWQEWERHARAWSERLAEEPDLVTKLVNFSNPELK